MKGFPSAMQQEDLPEHKAERRSLKDLKKCSCLVGAMKRLEKLEMSQEHISHIESIMEYKMQKVDQGHKQHLEKVDNKRYV